MTSIRVLCVDDHALVREGIGLILAREPDIRVVANAADGAEAVALHRLHRPDITLMDVRLPILDGFAATTAICRERPDARIIILSVYEGAEDIHRALAAGAITYLPKHILSSELIDIVRRVHAGEHPVPEEVATALRTRASQPGISPREVEVLRLLSDGRRNRQIGHLLGIAEETVRAHLRRIYEKLGVCDRTAAVTVANTRGIIHLDAGALGDGRPDERCQIRDLRWRFESREPRVKAES